MFQGLSKLCPVNPTIHVYVILLAFAMAKIVKIPCLVTATAGRGWLLMRHLAQPWQSQMLQALDNSFHHIIQISSSIISII
jgi:hypothetical protein